MRPHAATASRWASGPARVRRAARGRSRRSRRTRGRAEPRRQRAPLAERMVERGVRLAEREGEELGVVRVIAGIGSVEGVGDARKPEFAKLAREHQEVVDELQLIGVELKDADAGLLDFPA